MAQDMDGQLAIDLARKNRQLDTMQLLLNPGTHRSDRNSPRQVALALERGTGGEELVSMTRSMHPSDPDIVGLFQEPGMGKEANNINKQILVHPAREENNFAFTKTPPASEGQVNTLGDMARSTSQGPLSMPKGTRQRVTREFRIMYRPLTGMPSGQTDPVEEQVCGGT